MSDPMTIDEIARELSRIAHHVDFQWGKLDKVLDAIEVHSEAGDGTRKWADIATDCGEAATMLDSAIRRMRFLSARLSK